MWCGSQPRICLCCWLLAEQRRHLHPELALPCRPSGKVPLNSLPWELDPKRLKLYRLPNKKLHCLGAGSYGQVGTAPLGLRILTCWVQGWQPAGKLPAQRVSRSLRVQLLVDTLAVVCAEPSSQVHDAHLGNAG